RADRGDLGRARRGHVRAGRGLADARRAVRGARRLPPLRARSAHRRARRPRDGSRSRVAAGRDRRARLHAPRPRGQSARALPLAIAVEADEQIPDGLARVIRERLQVQVEIHVLPPGTMAASEQKAKRLWRRYAGEEPEWWSAPT